MLARGDRASPRRRGGAGPHAGWQRQSTIQRSCWTHEVRLRFQVADVETGFLAAPLECRFWHRGIGDLTLVEPVIVPA